MKIIKAYSFETRFNPAVLETSVREKLSKGWQPLGGLALAYDAKGEYLVYGQAMVLYEDAEPSGFDDAGLPKA